MDLAGGAHWWTWLAGLTGGPARLAHVDVLGWAIDRAFGLPRRRRPLVVERRIGIPMPDGAVLLADHYRAPGAGPAPVVLVRTPYGRGAYLGRMFGSSIAGQGFQVVVQSVRGTFGSGGELAAFHQERADGLATLAWLRAQPWCDGRVAMAGVSYLGYTQWAVGPYAGPPLAAMCLGATASEFTTSHYPGDGLSLYGSLSWAALVATQERARAGGVLPDPRQGRRVARAMRHLPLREADVVAAGRPVRFWQDILAHAGPDDEFWAPADHSGAVARLRTPVTMVAGWHDVFLPGQLRDFVTLAAAGAPVRLTIGPWAHGQPAMMRTTVRDQLSWLDACLNGGARPAQRGVRAYLQHGGRWLRLPGWPPPDAVATPLYLGPAGALDWRPAPDGEPDRFTYDPADPTPSVGGPLLSGKTGQRDNRALEARPDVLVYTTPPLERDRDVVGDVHAEIYLRTDVAHADVFVRVCDVAPSGRSLNVCDGVLRLRPGRPAPGPDGVVRATVRMFPTGYRFRRGHRIRVLVTGGAFPRYARNHGTGEPPGDALRMRPRQYEVLHGETYPSQVVLPVLP